MSGTRLTSKKFDRSWHVFQLGPLSLPLGLMAQASLEEFQLSALSPQDAVDTCRLRGWGPWGGLHQVQVKFGWAVARFSLFWALPLCGPVIWPCMSQYACSNCHEHSNFFLARVFPRGRASGSVCLANWPIHGENTLIPSLRVDPQKKFFYPQKSRQGLMAQSWARLMTFLGECMVSPSEEEVYDGGTLTFSVDGPKGLGSGPRLGGSDGQKILRLPTGGVCVGTPGHKDGIALPHLYMTWWPLEVWGKFSLNGCHVMENSAGMFCFHIWGPKHVGYQAHLEKIWLELMHFSAGTPLPSLGVDGPGLPGRISIEHPITPQRHRHVPSSRPGSLMWFTPSPIEIELGCDAKFFSVPSTTPPSTGRMARYEPVHLQHLPWTL